MASEVTIGVAAAADEFGWQASCSGLSARLGLVRSRGLWADCEVLVGAARTPVRAHRVLLAAASPVLAAMLYGPLAAPPTDPDHKPLLMLPDLHVDTFHLLLDYMYTDNMTINSSEMACNLYKAANYLILPHVQTLSKTFLLNDLSSESVMNKVLDIYELAELYDDKEIMEKCLELMGRKTMAVLEGVEGVRAETLRRLFALPTLTIASELDLVRAAERWLRARCPALPPTAPQENGTNLGIGDPKPVTTYCGEDKPTTECDGLEDGNDPKMLIRDAVKEIRFLCMEPTEFASHDMSALLTESESFAIASNLFSDGSHIAMPDGFSLSKEIRKYNKFTVKINVNSTVFKSAVHVLEDFSWRIFIDETGIYLENIPGEDYDGGWYCRADFEFIILSHKKGIPNLQYKDETMTGFDAFFFRCDSLDWNFLRDPANGYVCDGEVTFMVTIDQLD